MKNPVFSFFALFVIISVLSCNNETSHAASDKDSTSQQADLTQTSDTNPATDTKSTGTTAGEPVTPSTDNNTFNKVLSYKNISFKLITEGKGSLQELTIQPSGLSADNKAIILETDPVVSANVADLNSDGYPELLVFTQSAGSGSYGKVIAYSVNNGKSISRVTFPATADNERINKGYMGHDRFNVVNNQLVQTFPIYGEDDTNAGAINKDRVVTYKLINGEASRVFVVEQVKERARK